MSTQEFFPYIAAPGAVELYQGAEAGNGDHDEAGSLCFLDESIKVIHLEASASLSRSAMSRVLDPIERDDPPVQLLLRYRSIGSRKRGAWLMKGGPTIYHAEICLDRDEWTGLIEMQAMLVRVSSNKNLDDGYATDKGAKLAWSEPMTVRLEEIPALTGRYIDVQWADFETDPRFSRHAARNLFDLDTRGPVPCLFLNSSFPRAKSVLSSEGTSSRIARTRDGVFAGIVHQVWSSLLTSAINKLVERQEHLTTISDGGLEDSWEGYVLNDWAPALFEEFEPAAAIQQLEETVTNGAGVDDVMARIARAIQTRAGTGDAFEKLMQEIGGT